MVDDETFGTVGTGRPDILGHYGKECIQEEFIDLGAMPARCIRSLVVLVHHYRSEAASRFRICQDPALGPHGNRRIVRGNPEDSIHFSVGAVRWS